MNVNIKVAATEQTKCPYRSLWFTVIHHAYIRAVERNDKAAIIFFTAKNGRFSELCVLLDLDEHEVREQVLLNINERRENNGR